MSVKLLTEHNLELISSKKCVAQARLKLHLSKCHIVENHLSRLIYCPLYEPANENLVLIAYAWNSYLNTQADMSSAQGLVL